MVRVKGLEPPRLAALVPKTSVSTIPPHPRGAVDRNRTYDLLITSQLLCLLSYNGLFLELVQGLGNTFILVGYEGLEPPTSSL